MKHGGAEGIGPPNSEVHCVFIKVSSTVFVFFYNSHTITFETITWQLLSSSQGPQSVCVKLWQVGNIFRLCVCYQRKTLMTIINQQLSPKRGPAEHASVLAAALKSMFTPARLGTVCTGSVTMRPWYFFSLYTILPSRSTICRESSDELLRCKLPC